MEQHCSAAVSVAFPAATALTPWHGASWENQVEMEPFSLLQILLCLCHRLSPALARGRATEVELAWGRKGWQIKWILGAWGSPELGCQG